MGCCCICSIIAIEVSWFSLGNNGIDAESDPSRIIDNGISVGSVFKPDKYSFIDLYGPRTGIVAPGPGALWIIETNEMVFLISTSSNTQLPLFSVKVKSSNNADSNNFCLKGPDPSKENAALGITSPIRPPSLNNAKNLQQKAL